MYPVSQRFKDALKQSHRVVTRVDVYKGTAPIYENLAIADGFVHADKSAANRRRCDVTLQDEGDLTPKRAGDLLHPLSGNELHIYRGIVFPDGTEEQAKLGVFGIEDANVDDTGETLNIKAKGFDRSKRVQRARYVDPYFVAEGTNVATAIRNLLVDRYPGVEIGWVDSEVTTETTPPMIFGTGGWSGGGDPWKSLTMMAESIGHNINFDGDGVAQLQPEPDPTNDSITYEYEEGPNSVLLYVTRDLTRDEVFNHVIAFGLNTATDTPIRVDAVDDDPNSPTYIGDPPGSSTFGDVPTYYRSTMLLTSTQAQTAAEAELRKKLGTPEKARFISIVNPAHEVDDVILISRARAGLEDSRHVIDKLAIPLRADQSMNATCRERRIG